MTEYMLTTEDNPYNPFTEFDEWYAFDEAKGYRTLSYLAWVLDEIADDYDELPEEEQAIAYATALDEILELNVRGVYRKVANPEEDDGEDDGEDEDVDEDEWAEMLAEMPDADDMARADVGRDNFERYWTRGKGLARWRFHPHPWTRLRGLLRKHPKIRDPEGLASTYFRKVFGYWPGHRKGKNPTGPG